MSDPRIAVVAEGATDFVLIEAALRAILPVPFVAKLLQPEPTVPRHGEGWGGVLKWCLELNGRKLANLDADPTLAGFDLVVLQLDADVASKSYNDLGAAMAAKAAALPTLPCALHCPPAASTVQALMPVLMAWLGMASLGPRGVLCVPSKAIEAWLAAAVFPGHATLLAGLECAMNMEGRLANLPKAQRVRKSVLQYRGHADKLRQAWGDVTTQCSQALAFDTAVRAVAAVTPRLQ